MKSGLRILLLGVLILLFLVFGVYLLLAWYYRDSFSLQTWINGVYCTGKTVEEVNAELIARTEEISVTLVDKDENIYRLFLEDADSSVDYTKELQLYIEKQNPYLWIDNLISGRNHVILPQVSFAEEKLENMWENLPFVKKEREEAASLSIQLSKEGYVLIDGYRDRLDREKSFLLFSQMARSGGGTLSLVESGCYADLPWAEEEQEVFSLWEKIKSFQDCHIVYDMGDASIPVDAGVVCHFITLEEDGSFLLDEDGELILHEDEVEAFISQLAEEYNTFDKKREFQATRGDVITVQGGTYGTLLDMEAEFAYLTQAVREKKKEVHIPSYKQEGEVRGKDDIGDTYIEIDMTKQKMYYYQDGVCLVETEIVTGNTGRRMGTPEGVNYVYAKQKNRILRGPGYASPVKFWMPVKGNIGIHDASWRSEFGGEIYKTSGSHGCINTPKEQMELLYELVEVGTPVIMFY